jgi:hypothetical protein
MTHAVIWNEDGNVSLAGKLELENACVTFSGSAPGSPEIRRKVPLAELSDAHYGRLSHARGGRDQGLVLVRLDGRRIEIASVEALGAARELAESIADACCSREP